MFYRYVLTAFAIVLMMVFGLSGCENYAERTHESWVEKPPEETYDDSTVYAKISYAVNTDPDLNGSNIEVQVNDGHVMLTGTVVDNHQMTKVNLLTWMVDGVKDVDNQIAIE